tara:strand:- start:422 stop:733 length:312 start_codon:yes stop_codon:yes gene_type:complete
MAFQTWSAGQVLTAAQLTQIQQLQYQGGQVSVGTGGTTVTFIVGRFTNAPVVTALGGYNVASGADPTGFVFVPYLGNPSTSSVVLKTTATQQVVFWHAINTNI